MVKKKRGKFILINRIHINGRNKKNNWKSVGRTLKIKLKPIEETKAIGFTNRRPKTIKKYLKEYNKKNHTDFFI